MIYVFLAEGFEETEALVPVDLLRRSGKEVILVGVGDNIVRSSHGVTVVADTIAQEIVLDENLEMIILPGGMPGTLNLEKSPYVQNAVDYCAENEIYIGAICAAPSILGHKELLKGRKAVCYTGFESELYGAEISDGKVEEDGIFITARGAGVAVEFALKLVEKAVSEEESNRQRKAILFD
ncbi:MAG: DJ-1/PfpI family protein [Ruminococcus sp.]|nr:DJ-1/PfpI family protein [Ruminococcus sp.]